MSAFFTIFFSVFFAELGDKTQLATVLFSADGAASRLTVFAAAASALVVSTGVAVALGAAAERYLAFMPLKLIAGIGFIAIGGFLVFEHFSKAAS